MAATVILDTTLTEATEYSSGPLLVGDYREISVDLNITDLTSYSGIVIQFSRVGADDAVYPLSSTQIEIATKMSWDLGMGLPINRAFGDRIQIDIIFPANTQISTSLSVIGK